MRHLIFQSLAILIVSITATDLVAQKVNPKTNINWVAITGTGAPAAACGSINYGQPYQDTSVTPNTTYTCGTDGWAKRNLYVPPVTVADITITIGTTSIPATSCLPSLTTYNTATMTGLVSTMQVGVTWSADYSAVSGWTPATPGLYITLQPMAGVIKWQVCNATATAITPGASTTWNVGAK